MLVGGAWGRFSPATVVVAIVVVVVGVGRGAAAAATAAGELGGVDFGCAVVAVVVVEAAAAVAAANNSSAFMTAFRAVLPLVLGMAGVTTALGSVKCKPRRSPACCTPLTV